MVWVWVGVGFWFELARANGLRRLICGQDMGGFGLDVGGFGFDWRLAWHGVGSCLCVAPRWSWLVRRWFGSGRQYFRYSVA